MAEHADAIRLERIRRGIGLRQAADESGISFNTLARIERGANHTVSNADACSAWLAESRVRPANPDVAALIAARLAPLTAALVEEGDVAILAAIKAVRAKAADERAALHAGGKPLTDYDSGVLDGLDYAWIAGRKAASRPTDERTTTSIEEWWACDDAYEEGYAAALAASRPVDPGCDDLATRIEALATELDAAARNRHHEADGAMQAAIAGRLRDALGVRP